MKVPLFPPMVPSPMTNNGLRDYISELLKHIASNDNKLPCTVVSTPLGDSKIDCTFDTEDNGKWHVTIDLSPVQ